MAHTDQDLLVARALGALDDAGLRDVDEHLTTCADCAAELVAWNDAAALLAHDAPLIEPNVEVRKRILDAVGSGRATRSEQGRVIPIASRERSSKVWPMLLRLAAAIAFVALVLGTFFFWKRDLELRREVARLTREINSQQRELARERETVALLTSPNAKRTELAGTDEAKTARAMLAFDPQSGRAVLLTENLPATPADKAYELWFIANGHPMPGKVFTVDSAGRATISDQVPAPAREHAVFAITLEPRAGVSAPTGPIYLSSPSL